MIRGETDHYDFVCAEAARGIQDVQLRTGVPCAFGVLTVENMDQALARTGGGKRDQGAPRGRGRAGDGRPDAARLEAWIRRPASGVEHGGPAPPSAARRRLGPDRRALVVGQRCRRSSSAATACSGDPVAAQRAGVSDSA